MQDDLAGGEPPVCIEGLTEIRWICRGARDKRRQKAATGRLASTSVGQAVEQLIEPLVDRHGPHHVGLDGRATFDAGAPSDRLTIAHRNRRISYNHHMISAREMTDMGADRLIRLLTLNISGPSAVRAGQLARFLGEANADVLVLTETRDNDGTRWLLDWCRDEGYSVNGPLPASSGERGVAVARRIGPASKPVTVDVDLPHRLVIDELADDRSLLLVAAYVPSRDASVAKIERKRTFLDQMARALRRFADGPGVVFMGDLNVIGRSHVPRYPAFKAWEYDALEEIAAAGFADVYADLNPGVQVHSWVGRTGSGYRYDYAFVSQGLSGAVEGCEYLQEPRERGITDHAAVMLTVRPPLADPEARVRRAS
ncbi:MAG TPA: endonuclease/exonuclease/phosphatase family protein [Acidimicrobiales bacterium]|nr:endonuclease/exonuclease/phosphatase family protein [Acidimicrobiales bacterium]